MKVVEPDLSLLRARGGEVLLLKQQRSEYGIICQLLRCLVRTHFPPFYTLQSMRMNVKRKWYIHDTEILTLSISTYEISFENDKINCHGKLMTWLDCKLEFFLLVAKLKSFLVSSRSDHQHSGGWVCPYLLISQIILSMGGGQDVQGSFKQFVAHWTVNLDFSWKFARPS